jgi:hypothetical protein
MDTRGKCLSIALALGLGLAVALLLLSALGAQRVALAQAGTGVIRVATTGSDAVGCGGAGNPCRTVQYAVNAAQPGEEIRVATGVYTGVHNIPALSTDLFTATQLVFIDKSVQVRGGYPAGNWTAPNPAVYPTTLDAEGAGRVVLITGTVTVVLDGLRITGGNAVGLGGAGTTYAVAGGGVWAQGADVTIVHCDIRANGAYSSTASFKSGFGGGVYLSECPASVLAGNTVIDNWGSLHGHGYGGAVYLYNCDGAQLVDNLIRDNTGGSGNGYGGAVNLSNSYYVVIERNLFQDNVGSFGANYYGGGLYLLHACFSRVAHNTFMGNVGGSAWSWGGGMFVDVSHDVVVAANTFADNVASTWQGWGGGLCTSSGWEITLDGNVFRHNRGTTNGAALSWGGGAYLMATGPYTLSNNAFVENEVTTGGSGLYVESAAALLLHNTFYANSGGDGTGVCVTGTLGTAAMTNTIVAGHAVGVNATGGATVTMDTTLWFGNAQNGLGNVTHSGDRTGDPLLQPDGYHVTLLSAAVDQAVDVGVTRDIDWQRRPAGPAPDIGADEFMYGLYLPVLVRH